MNDVHLVHSLGHLLRVVPHVQLAKSRQAGGPHPDHEVLICPEVRRGVACSIAIGIPHPPVEWNSDGIQRSRGRDVLEQVLVGVPRNARLAHVVRLFIVTHGPRAIEGVVEDGIGNQPTGIEGLASAFLRLKRLTCGAANLRGCDVLTGELLVEEGVDIATVVLVEVCELIVEEYGRAHVFRYRELYHAFLRLVGDAVECDIDSLPFPLCLYVGVVLELGEYVVGGHGVEGVIAGVLVACRVVDGDLLDLRACVQEQATDGGEDDADGEEEGEDGLWCEDWSVVWSALCVCAVGGPLMLDDLLPCLQPLLSKRSVCWLIQPSATCPGSDVYHDNLPSCPSRISRVCSIIPRGRVWVDWYRYSRG